MTSEAGHASGAFPVLRSLLAPEALAEAVGAAYGLADVRCRLIKSTIRDVYRVDSRAASYVLIVYRHDGRTTTEIEAELDLLDYLHLEGVAVAPSVPTRAGERMLTLAAPEGPRHAALFRYVDGTTLGRSPEPDDARRYGRLIARVHQIADAWDEAPRISLVRPPIDVRMLVDRPLARIVPVLAYRPADVAFLQRAADVIRRRLDDVPTEPPGYGLVHGDVIGTNVLVGPDRSLTLLDFDFFGAGWHAYDVASFARDVGMSRGPEASVAQFVAGYREIRPLADWETAAIPLFSAARGLFRLGNWRMRVDEWGSAAFPDDAIEREIGTIRDALARLG